MYFGRIPRFSPSFSFAEAAISLRKIAVPPEDLPDITSFEREFASFIGAKHAIMVPSARYAFYLLLQAYNIGEGDEVIIPGLTYFAIPAMAMLKKTRIVFADVGLTSHVLDPKEFERAITPKTRAVVPTHLYGTPCDMTPILEIAKRHNVVVIEDCAQSTGARYNSRRVGSFGDAAYYTFGLTKNITTLSGAMITTNDDKIAAFVRNEVAGATPADLKKSAKEAVVGMGMKLATHPFIYPWTLHPVLRVGNKMGKDPIHEPFGEPEVVYKELPSSFKKSKPRAVNAAVGSKQLSRIDELNGARIRNGRYLDEHLANIGHGLVLPTYPAGAEPIYMSFVVHHPRRDDLMAALRRRGVDTTFGYMNDCSNHDLFPDFRSYCPNAAEIKAKQMHLPVHPSLDEKDLVHMVEAVRSACKELG